MTGKQVKTAVLSGILSCAFNAQAADMVWAYDGFNYAMGQALQSSAGGTGWAGDWNVDGTMSIAGGLSYRDAAGQQLAVTGNAVETSGVVTLAERFTVADFGAPNTTVWVSLLQRSLAHADDVKRAGVTLGVNGELSGAMAGGFLRGANGSTRTGVWLPNSSISAVGSGSIAPLQTVLHVIRLDFAAPGQNDSMRIWRDPLLNTDPGAPAVSGSFADVANILTGVSLFSAAETTDSHYIFDELRIGSSFAAVTPTMTSAVPEPATSALLLLGAAAIASRLRMQSRTVTAGGAPCA